MKDLFIVFLFFYFSFNLIMYFFLFLRDLSDIVYYIKTYGYTWDDFFFGFCKHTIIILLFGLPYAIYKAIQDW